MTEHPNSHLTRRMVDAFSRGDLDTVGGCFSPDAVWDLPGRSTVAGTYKGPQEILGFLAKAYELSGGTLSVEVIDVLGSDWGAVQVQHVTADHDGRHLTELRGNPRPPHRRRHHRPHLPPPRSIRHRRLLRLTGRPLAAVGDHPSTGNRPPENLDDQPVIPDRPYPGGSRELTSRPATRREVS